MTTFTIPGRPVPKGRHRTVTKSGHTWEYPEPKSEAYEELIAWCCTAADLELGRDKGNSVLIDCHEDHVLVTVREALLVPRRADLDNVCKAVIDGIGKYGKGYGWNDRQVMRLVGRVL